MPQLSRVVCALVVAAAISGCEKAPDPGDQVRDALKTANIEEVKVNYDRDSKAVHLTGSVESPDIKQRAEQIANRAVGTSGNVLNEVTVKGPAENRADDLDGNIRQRLNDMVDKDPTLRDRDVNFDVNNGAVEVNGSVASAAEKNRVTEMVRGVGGVKDMANGLEVRADKYAGKKQTPNSKR
jgi:osmotically-inducible protein OsmY